jgi:hypothetical protein
LKYKSHAAREANVLVGARLEAYRDLDMRQAKESMPRYPLNKSETAGPYAERKFNESRLRKHPSQK